MSFRVFVTGIDGFTGRYLQKYLQNLGYDVFGGSLNPKAKNHLPFNLLDKNTLKSALKMEFDYIIHLAAVSFAMANTDEIVKTNELGTLNLLEALSEVKFKRAIFASSASVYGGATEKISETSPLNPPNPYAKSKLYMEQEALKSGLNIIITRPFNYTGVGQGEQFLIPKIIKHFKEKIPTIKLGNLTPKREYNDVCDVVRIYAELLATDFEIKSGEIINIGSGKAYGVGEIMDILRNLTKFNIAVNVDESLIRPNDPELLICDTTKLQNLGIQPCKGDILGLLTKMMG